MTGRTGRGRRAFLRRTATACVGATVAGSAGADSVPVAAAGTAAVLRETRTASYRPDDATFRFEYRYSVPDSLRELRVEAADLALSTVSLAGSRNVEREDDRTFVWQGGEAPALTFERRVESPVHDGNGYATDDAAFAATVGTRVGYSYVGSEPTFRREATFDGTGHAGTGWCYAGAHDTRVWSTDRATYTVVLPAAVTPPSALDAVLELYGYADGHLPSRTGYDAVTAFVLPSDRLADAYPAGQAVGSSVLLDAAAVALERVGNVPVHEYVHVHLGSFGDGAMTWLTEGAAEYLGGLLSLNAGVGTVSGFLAFVRTEEYGDAVLADVRRGDATRADYRKGAHVLAALDAEIRRRSTGQGSLLDVVGTTDHDLATVDGFAAAAAAAAGDDALADWVREHVRTTALPEVPDDPSYYVLGDRPASALPTATPTPTATPSPTPRPTRSAATARSRTLTTAPGPADTTQQPADRVPVETDGFGAGAAGVGALVAALLAARRRG